jgi:hypothetical protein
VRATKKAGKLRSFLSLNIAISSADNKFRLLFGEIVTQRFSLEPLVRETRGAVRSFSGAWTRRFLWIADSRINTVSDGPDFRNPRESVLRCATNFLGNRSRF